MFDGVVGHEKQKRVLQRALAHGAAHAYLFSGPKGVGKTTLAEAAAAAKMGCGIAELSRQPNCIRLQRPIDEKTGEAKKSIPVDAVEDFVNRLALSSFGGHPKIGIIEDADAMNDHGQNALLKTIEEPKGDTLLFFIATDAERVLPTIRSRVIQLSFGTVAPEEIAQLVADPEVIAMAKGRPGLAVQLQQPEVRAQYEAIANEVAGFLGGKRAARLVQATALTKGEDADAGNLPEIYQRLAVEIHEELLAKCGTMSRDECRARAQALSLLADTPSLLAGNASQTLVLEAIGLALP